MGMQPRKDRRTEKAERGEKRETKFDRLKMNQEGKIIIEEDEEEEQLETGEIWC